MDANETMREELREAIGDEAYARMEEVPLPERRGDSTVRAALDSNRLLLTVAATAALVLAALSALVLDSFWALLIPLAVLGAGTALVVRQVMGLLATVETPAATTVADLEAHGVTNPERELNVLIELSAGRDPGSRGGRAFSEEAGQVQAGDPAAQQIANTPSAEPTRPVGP